MLNEKVKYRERGMWHLGTRGGIRYSVGVKWGVGIEVIISWEVEPQGDSHILPGVPPPATIVTLPCVSTADSQ